MDERSLLLLGILKAQSLHGYQINEFIDRNLSNITDMKKPTAYAILDRLSKNGYVSQRTEKEGNRPTRKVYTITEKGEEAFKSLLVNYLSSSSDVKFSNDIALLFIDHLSKDERFDCLDAQLHDIEEKLTFFEHLPYQHQNEGVNYVFLHQRHRLLAEKMWLEQLIERLKNAESKKNVKA